MLRRSAVVARNSSPLFNASNQRGATGRTTGAANGAMRGGVPRVYYSWLRPGSDTRRRFEKMRNPFVDLNAGTSIYYRNTQAPLEAMQHEADAQGVKGMDNAVDLYNEHRIIPDLYPEGFQWQHKLNTEYNQWRSNTWFTPELIPREHRGRLLANFQVNVVHIAMRVAKFSPKDARQFILCSLYVGTGKGIAGFGQAIAPSVGEAKKEALKVAFDNLIAVNLEDEGIVYPLRLNHDGCRVLIYPSAKLSCAFFAADVVCAFGFWGMGVKCNEHIKRRARNMGGKVQALFVAFEKIRSSTEIAHARGKIPVSLVSNIFPLMEETRRRKGMFAMHPAGKTGTHLSPNRVVDNRLPDHLKKTYYDDKYWKDFFAGAPGRLNEPTIGMRPDELRALVPPTDARAPPALLAAGRAAGARRRRTLADVLQRANRKADSVGELRVVNPYLDAKIPTHAKSLFHLH